MRACEECGQPLPLKSRKDKRFCTKRCVNVAMWRANKVAMLAANRQWREATRERRLAAARAARSGRTCIECGDRLPAEARLRRVFCSRKCINRRADRERPHQRREAIQKRRALLSAGSAPAGVSERDWLRLVARHSGRCAYCCAARPLTMDHVTPVSKGGRHSIGNILPACQPCNASKRDLLLVDWKRRILPGRLAA